MSTDHSPLVEEVKELRKYLVDLLTSEDLAYKAPSCLSREDKDLKREQYYQEYSSKSLSALVFAYYNLAWRAGLHEMSRILNYGPHK